MESTVAELDPGPGSSMDLRANGNIMLGVGSSTELRKDGGTESGAGGMVPSDAG